MRINALQIKSLGLVAALLMTSVAVADDAEPAKKKKQGAQRNAASQIIKQLKDVSLTQEQQTKLKELGKKSMEKMREIRKEAQITPQLMKKRAEAAKELKDSGKKGAELIAAINEKTGFTTEQAAAMKKADAIRMGLMKAAIGMLSDEQKANLPKRLLKIAEGREPGDAAKKGKGKGKKKKEAAEAAK